MTIDTIASGIADKTNMTKKSAEDAYTAFVDLIVEKCNEEDETTVTLPKIGKFSIKAKEAYVGRNPKNNKPVEVPASRRVTFSSFPSFKQKLNTTEKKVSKKSKSKSKAKGKKVKKVSKKK